MGERKIMKERVIGSYTERYVERIDRELDRSIEY